MAITAIGAAVVGATVASQVEQTRVAKRTVQAQRKAQADALSRANQQSTLAAQANRKANAQAPNVTGILEAEQALASAGGITALAGARGDRSTPTLGRPSLLGDV